MTTKQNNNKEEKEQKAFDPYAPHKIKWYGWLLLVAMIGVVTWIIITKDSSKSSAQFTDKVWDSKMVQKCEGEVFGTFYHITYESNKTLQDGINAELEKVDLSLSPFNESSTITAINNNTSMKADKMFTEVFTLAKSVSEETNGAFDITVAPLVNLWGFGFKQGTGVSDAAVDSILQYTGFTTVTLSNGEVQKKHAETMLDCSAIAKGYGVDVAGRYLESQGVSNYMVEIGGEIRVRGCNPKGEKWRIGINKPIDDETQMNQELQEILETTDIAMATSGNYRNFYVKDGKKYAHTIDPHTGHPVQHNILSSTVLAEDCSTADAYATAFMVLGLDKTKDVLKKHKELKAYLIYSDDKGEMQVWSNLK